MKRAERDPIHRGMRMDAYFARGPHSLSREAAAFWWFRQRSEQDIFWPELYSRFSAAKPSSGLCALFYVADLYRKATIGLAGMDRIWDGTPYPTGPHDGP